MQSDEEWGRYGGGREAITNMDLSFVFVKAKCSRRRRARERRERGERGRDGRRED